MEIEQLREMLILAEKKNYAVAAEQLYISQSALSRHISQMEDKLGVQLFERNPRKVSLTRYGEALIPYAQQMISLEDESLAEIERIRKEENGSVTIGSVRELSTYGVMNLITGFIAENRNTAISVFNADISTLRDRLAQNRADAVIIYDTSDETDSSFRRLTLCEDRIVAVVSKDHPFAGRSRLTIQDLANEECIIQDDDRLINRIILDSVRGSGISIRRSSIQVSGVGQLELACQGLGIAFEYEKVAKRRGCEDLALIPFTAAKKVRLDLVWRKNISEAGNVFISYVRKNLKKYL